MKNVLIFMFALLACATKSQAQMLEIYNLRSCPIEVSMKGECPGGLCDGVAILFRIPAGDKVLAPSFAAAASHPYVVSAGSCTAPTGFMWHGAEVQTVFCSPCSGYGVSVGDNTCPHFVTGIVYNNGPNCFTGSSPCTGTQCAVWVPIGPGSARITAY